jgi:hypothetical protein
VYKQVVIRVLTVLTFDPFLIHFLYIYGVPAVLWTFSSTSCKCSSLESIDNLPFRKLTQLLEKLPMHVEYGVELVRNVGTSRYQSIVNIFKMKWAYIQKNYPL